MHGKASEVGTRPDMRKQQFAKQISGFRIAGRIVGVRSTKQSVGIAIILIGSNTGVAVQVATPSFLI